MIENDSKIRLIDLERIQTNDIRAILANYYVEGLLGEDDGADDDDIVIQRSVTFYVKVDVTYTMLRFFCYMATEVAHDKPEFLEYLGNSNAASSSVKYSLLSSTVMAEYGIPLIGHIDHKHLLKVVEHFANEVKSFKMLLQDFLKE
jgi:hypothetical protein